MKVTFVLFFLITLLTLPDTLAGFGRSRSGNYGYKEITGKNAPKSSYLMNDGGRINDRTLKNGSINNLRNTTSKGAGITAWGIIGIILAAILIATTGYYAFVFYPFLCKKERNYDMIELTNVV